MTEAASAPEGTPTVKLGGQDWPVPELVWSQLRKVRRSVIDLTTALQDVVEKQTDGSEKIIKTSGQAYFDLTDEQADQMADVVFVGVCAGTPALSRTDFESLRITAGDLLASFLVVRAQSGVYRKLTPEEIEAAKAAEGDKPAGEAAAESKT